MSEPNPENLATLSSVFKGTEWIFFNLDDTLHSYRIAASHATRCVLDTIIAQHPRLDLADLQASYNNILASDQDQYFTNGKTSHECRAARFTSLLNKYDVDVNVQDLLDIYEKSITEKLELKPYAIDLLRALKNEGKRVAIVSEGPHDAQERAISSLGIGSYIDHLATSNKVGVSKSGGLFKKVAEGLGIGEEEVLVIGDSWDMDVQPAIKSGMRAVWVNEGAVGVGREEQPGETRMGIVRVTTLGELVGKVE